VFTGEPHLGMQMQKSDEIGAAMEPDFDGGICFVDDVEASVPLLLRFQIFLEGSEALVQR
jgi:hypothetical protein